MVKKYKNYKVIGGVVLVSISIIFLLFKYSLEESDQIKVDDTEIFVDETNLDQNLEDSQNSQNRDLKNKNQIVVEIKGEVNNPDIYWLDEDNIIDDIIKKAGGLTKDADISSINRAEKLKNHQSVIIPNKNEPQKSQNVENSSSSGTEQNLININTATESELDSLPGIGPAKAKSIIEYRESNGLFQSIDDIKNVKGIGDGFYEKLKDKITV